MYRASISMIYLSHYAHNATKVSEIMTFFATKDPEKMWLSSFTSRIDLAMHHNLSWQYAIVFTRGIQARRFECGQPQSYLQHVSIRTIFLVMMLFIIKFNEYHIDIYRRNPYCGQTLWNENKYLHTPLKFMIYIYQYISQLINELQ